VVAASLVTALRADPVVAGSVIVDGSFGHAAALAGPNFSIPSSIGRIASQKSLFESFNTFNLEQGDVATFSGPGSIKDVLVRVTGGTSNIDGVIRSTMPAADIYFIDPFGVILGPHSKLDVDGSVAITTGQYIRLGKGKYFYGKSGPITLTSALPEAYGFLSSSASGSISVGNSSGTVTTLHVQTGKVLALVGNQIKIQSANLTAPDGALTVVGAAGQGEVPAQPAAVAVAVGASGQRSAVAITNSVLNVNATLQEDGGQIVIDGSGISLDQTRALSLRYDGNFNGIYLNATGRLTLAGGSVDASSSGFGDAGTIGINAPHLVLRDTSILSQSTGLPFFGGVNLQTLMPNPSFVPAGGMISLTSQVVDTHGSVLLSAAALDGGSLGTVNPLPSTARATKDGEPANLAIDTEMQGRFIDGNTPADSPIQSDNSIPQTITTSQGSDAATFTVTGGTVNGTNEFFSFSYFDINLNQIVQIDPASTSIESILIRVTGGSPSNIEGLIQTAATKNPDLKIYLINPSGIAFGADGGIDDVDANGGFSFAVTTADFIGFAAGSFAFNSDTTSSPVGGATSAEPTTFGFTAKYPAGFSAVFGPSSANLLVVSPGYTFSAVSGGIAISGQNEYVEAGGDRTNLISVGSPGQVQLGLGYNSPAPGGLSSFSLMGPITISDEAQVIGTGRSPGFYARNGGNRIAAYLDSGSLDLFEDGQVFVNNANQSGTLSVDANTINISSLQQAGRRMNEAATTGLFAYSESQDPNVSTAIVVHADNISLSDSGEIDARANDDSNPINNPAGDVFLNVRDKLALTSRGFIQTNGEANAAAGSITINADSITIDDAAGGISSAVNNDTGAAGDILISARGDISIDAQGAGLSPISTNGPASRGGNVLIKSHGNISIKNVGVDDLPAINTAASEDANITLESPGQILLMNTDITAEAFRGNGGRITLDPFGSPGFVILDDSTINGLAQGGKTDVRVSIPVSSEHFVESTDSKILSNNVSAPVQTDIAAALVDLSASLQAPEAQLQESCPRLLIGPDISNFTLGGQGAEPLEPGGWMPDLSVDSSSNQPQHKGQH
jgi:filamentous hemagglutinin family protein